MLITNWNGSLNYILNQSGTAQAQNPSPNAVANNICVKRNSYYKVDGSCDTYVECVVSTIFLRRYDLIKNYAFQIKSKAKFAAWLTRICLTQGYVAAKKACPDGLHYNPAAVWPQYPCGFPMDVPCVGRETCKLLTFLFVVTVWHLPLLTEFYENLLWYYKFRTCYYFILQYLPKLPLTALTSMDSSSPLWPALTTVVNTASVWEECPLSCLVLSDSPSTLTRVVVTGPTMFPPAILTVVI